MRKTINFYNDNEVLSMTATQVFNSDNDTFTTTIPIFNDNNNFNDDNAKF